MMGRVGVEDDDLDLLGWIRRRVLSRHGPWRAGGECDDGQSPQSVVAFGDAAVPDRIEHLMPFVGAEDHDVVAVSDVGEKAVRGGAGTERGIPAGDRHEFVDAIVDGGQTGIVLAECVGRDGEIDSIESEGLDRTARDVDMGDRGWIEGPRVHADACRVVRSSHGARLASMGDWGSVHRVGEVIVSRSPFLHPFARPGASAEEFVTIVNGEGAVLWDADGNEYVDAIASNWSCNLGHSRWELVDQIASQMAALENFNTFDIFTNESAERFCAFVAAAAPMEDCRVLLTTSAAESLSMASQLATLVRGGDRTVVRRLTTVDITEIESVFVEHGAVLAGVVIEPMLASVGVEPASAESLQRLRSLCDEHGVLLILDETITAFGRLGTWFAADHLGVVPDMITFGDTCTSGYLPMGGVIVGGAVLDVIESDPTFVLPFGSAASGNPSSCVAALENLALMHDEHLFDRAEAIAGRIGSGLDRLVQEGVIDAARGVGGFWAARLPASADANLARDAMFRDGVIVRAVGVSTIVLCPPLSISDDQLDRCVAALGTAARWADEGSSGEQGPEQTGDVGESR